MRGKYYECMEYCMFLKKGLHEFLDLVGVREREYDQQNLQNTFIGNVSKMIPRGEGEGRVGRQTGQNK